MIRIIVLFFLMLSLPLNGIMAQSNRDRNPARATIVTDPADKSKIRGQASIAFLNGRNFKRPKNQYQKALASIREQMTNASGLYITEYAKVQIASKQLIMIPFAIIAAEEPFELTVDETDNMEDYLKNGGFIYCENTLGTIRNSPVETSFRNMIDETLGDDAQFITLSSSHQIFRCFYDLNDGAPVIRRDAIINRSPLYAVQYDGCIVAVYSNRPYTVEWNRPEKNTLPLKFAINMIIFAVTRNGANTIRK